MTLPIAIIGMSARYAGAATLAEYWRNLRAGVCTIRPVPPNRWDMDKYYDPRFRQRGKIYCPWLGYLEDAESFDPLFFNIAPSEAEIIDPQQRIFVEEGYRTFEDAGYSTAALNRRRCAVYLGIIHNEYRLMLQKSREDSSAYSISNSFSLGAARLSYYLNLRGPTIAIDTACSSSLVAVHLACQALRSGEIDMALAGGTTLYLTPEAYVAMCEAGMLSITGKCRAFDNSADGFVPGEGVGAILLKRLEDAEADRDDIKAVIVASGINSDGKTNGITAPSLESQFQLIREIYARHQIDPETIGYVEAHGTGTKLGDPIELKALTAAFRERTSKTGYCALGSVKTNIGHTSGTAGIAGIHKILLCMRNAALVPTLNFETHNDSFDLSSSPFYVNTELREWRRHADLPLRATVSSFGLSGTNAHVVIEEYSNAERASSSRSLVEPQLAATLDLQREETVESTAPAREAGYVIALSARNNDQLRQLAARFVERWKSGGDVDWKNVSYTLLMGRRHFAHRWACVVGSSASALDMAARIENWLEGIGDPKTFASSGKAANKEEDQARSLGERCIDECTDASLGEAEYLERLTTIARLFAQGCALNYERLFIGSYRRVSLPTYPFAKERYWISPSSTKQHPTAEALSPVDEQLLGILDRVERGSLDVDGAVAAILQTRQDVH